MSAINYITPITCQIFDSGNLTTSWKKVSTDFGVPISIIRISNASNVAVIISFDGSNIHDWLSASGVLELSSVQSDFASHWPANTAVWLKQDTKSGKGNIYISAYSVFRNI